MENFHIKPAILIAPLPWGLGHAARCIPLINGFLNKGCEVIICAGGGTKQLLTAAFPKVKMISIKGYDINYSKSSGFFALKILSQLPAIVSDIFKEHQTLKNILKQHNIDIVISDNRPGMFHKSVYSIYISHQLNIQNKSKFTGKLINRIHRFFIKRFNECWIPDDEHHSISGELSRPSVLIKTLKYIGPVSRFALIEKPAINYDIICILSGPEPQRTLLENILLKQLNQAEYKTFFVRGSEAVLQFTNTNALIEVVNFMQADKLNEKIAAGVLVICRSGYTSIMDLIKLRKKAVLIPTPGQTEQEYLSAFHQKNNTFLSFSQDEFDLETAIQSAKIFPYHFPQVDMDLYKLFIEKLIKMYEEKTLK